MSTNISSTIFLYNTNVESGFVVNNICILTIICCNLLKCDSALFSNFGKVNGKSCSIRLICFKLGSLNIKCVSNNKVKINIRRFCSLFNCVLKSAFYSLIVSCSISHLNCLCPFKNFSCLTKNRDLDIGLLVSEVISLCGNTFTYSYTLVFR